MKYLVLLLALLLLFGCIVQQDVNKIKQSQDENKLADFNTTDSNIASKSDSSAKATNLKKMPQKCSGLSQLIYQDHNLYQGPSNNIFEIAIINGTGGNIKITDVTIEGSFANTTTQKDPIIVFAGDKTKLVVEVKSTGMALDSYSKDSYSFDVKIKYSNTERKDFYRIETAKCTGQIEN